MDIQLGAPVVSRDGADLGKIDVEVTPSFTYQASIFEGKV